MLRGGQFQPLQKFSTVMNIRCAPPSNVGKHEDSAGFGKHQGEVRSANGRKRICSIWSNVWKRINAPTIVINCRSNSNKTDKSYSVQTGFGEYYKKGVAMEAHPTLATSPARPRFTTTQTSRPRNVRVGSKRRTH